MDVDLAINTLQRLAKEAYARHKEASDPDESARELAKHLDLMQAASLIRAAVRP